MTKRSEVRSPLVEIHNRHPSSFRMDFDHGGLPTKTALLWLLSDVFWHGVGQVNWEFLTAPPQRGSGWRHLADSGFNGTDCGVCLGVSIPWGWQWLLCLLSSPKIRVFWDGWCV